jgi:hypothetical protein
LTYLLDNNVVSYFLHSRREADLMEAAHRCPLAIAEEVGKELKRSRRDGDRFRAWFTGGRIASLAIGVGSEVDATFEALTPPTTERGKGERASIALAAHDASLVLVANDRNAMWLALAELHQPGERMIGVPVFLRRLHEQAALAPEALDAVMSCYPGRRPTWWADWRAKLQPAAAPV